jgi:hypothetical protein
MKLLNSRCSNQISYLNVYVLFIDTRRNLQSTRHAGFESSCRIDYWAISKKSFGPKPMLEPKYVFEMACRSSKITYQWGFLCRVCTMSVWISIKKRIAYCIKTAKGQVVAQAIWPALRQVPPEWTKAQPQPWPVAMEATLFAGWIYDFPKTACPPDQGSPWRWPTSLLFWPISAKSEPMGASRQTTQTCRTVDTGVEAFYDNTSVGLTILQQAIMKQVRRNNI